MDQDLSLLAGDNNQKFKDKTGNDINEKVSFSPFNHLDENYIS